MASFTNTVYLKIIRGQNYGSYWCLSFSFYLTTVYDYPIGNAFMLLFTCVKHSAVTFQSKYDGNHLSRHQCAKITRITSNIDMWISMKEYQNCDGRTLPTKAVSPEAAMPISPWWPFYILEAETKSRCGLFCGLQAFENISELLTPNQNTYHYTGSQYNTVELKLVNGLNSWVPIRS